MAKPIASLFLLLALSLTGSAATPPTEKKRTLRLVTWNVNWGVNDPAAVAKYLRASNADIVCLQETNSQWERELSHRLADVFPHRKFRESAGRMGGGLAFLSREKGIEKAYVRSDSGWFDAWVMKFPGGLEVLNLHLRPPVTESGNPLIGYFTTGDDRRAEVARFSSHLTPGGKAIVCGDLNESKYGQAVRWLTRRGYTNVLPQFDRWSPTWEWTVGPIKLRRRMDHILVSPGIQSVEARVTRVKASDHFPVSAVVQW